MTRYGAIYADPPWHFEVYEDKETGLITGRSTRRAERHYSTMTIDELCCIDVPGQSADDCVLFIWVTWPLLERSSHVIKAWGFTYKTCAFAWFKGSALPLFPHDARAQMGLGYWTRANSEVCLLATKGKPKRKHADVHQAILEPRREHSRKPDCIYERIERLVDGPYLELFARSTRPGWDAFGNEIGKFGEVA